MKRACCPTTFVFYSLPQKILTLGILLIILSSCLLQDNNKKEVSADQESLTPSQGDDTQREPKEPPVYNPPSVYPADANDPLYAQSWHLHSTGTSGAFASSQARIDEDVNVHHLHLQGLLGRGVRVAISDNGVELNHPDLVSRQIPGESRNYTSSNASEWRGRDPYPTSSGEVAAHGTAVAGLAVASGFNNIGSRGVAPLAQFAGFNFVGAGTTVSKLLDQATGSFDLFNYSYGRDSCAFTKLPDSYHDQLRLGAMNLRQGLGALYIKAAGNEYVDRRSNCQSGLSGNYTGNANLESDNNEPWTVVVGATDARGFAAYYSTPGSSLWISAPGGDTGVQVPALLTTDLTGCDKGFGDSTTGLTSFDRGENEFNLNCDYTSSMNGTSGATPLVTGGLALILSVNPQLTWRELKYLMAKTARKIDSGSRQIPHPLGFNLQGHTYLRHWITNAAGFNFHNWYGFGVLDVERAVNYLSEHDFSFGPWKELQRSSGTLSLGIPDNSATGVEHTIRIEEDWIIESVQLRLSVTHDYPGDLGVELRSPSGTVSTLMAINSGMVGTDLNDVLLSSNAFYFENAQGDWQVRIIDGAQDDVGVLTRWQINIAGHEQGTTNIEPRTIAELPSSQRREVTSVELNEVNSTSAGVVTKSDTSKAQKHTLEQKDSLADTVRQLTRGASLEMSLTTKGEMLVASEMTAKRLKDVFKVGDKRALLYTNESNLDAEILMIHEDGTEESIILDAFEQARWVPELGKSKEDFTWSFVKNDHFIQLKYQQNLWQEEIFSLPDHPIGLVDDIILNTREISDDELEILVYDKKRLRRYIASADQKINLSKTVPLEGEIGKPIHLASQIIYPLVQENKLILYTFETTLQEVARFEFPRRIGQVHLHQAESPAKMMVVMEMLGAGFWEKLGSYNLSVVELDLLSQDFKIIHSFETEGEDHLRDSILEGDIISVLGSTRTDFADQNFGDLDLTFFSVNLKGELQVKRQWGRKQKRIDSSGDEWGLRLFHDQGRFEIWAESTGPLLGAPLKTGWRSFMLRPGVVGIKDEL
jgi:subtilisin-like proprotein convertase family protein